MDHENESNDGVIDKNDMVEALRTICYEDRGYVYDRLLQSLRMSGHLGVLKKIFSMSDRSFPTRASQDEASALPSEALQWLMDNNILLVVNDYEYGLVDEFLRVRMLLDSAGENPRDMSNKLLSFSTLEYYPTSREGDKRDINYYEEVTRDFVKREYPKLRPKDPFEE
jgi:hypothetical protein